MKEYGWFGKAPLYRPTKKNFQGEIYNWPQKETNKAFVNRRLLIHVGRQLSDDFVLD